MEEAQKEFTARLAKALAALFGDNLEVAIHDLAAEDPEHTIIAIENGHVSNRRVGDGPSQVALGALRDGQGVLEDKYSYLTRTRDGRTLRSSTVYIRGSRGEPTGIFAINYDITGLLMAQSAIGALTDAQAQDEPKQIPTNVNELLDDLIEQSVKLVGKPVAMMNKDDKIRAIQFLNDSGAMLITRSGDKISNYFGISKYTLYTYLDAKNENA